MTAVEERARCAAPVAVLWEVLMDLPATTEQVPLTTGTGDPGPVRLGWSFTARTGLGPMHFDDEMVVTGLTPPRDGAAGRVRIVKTGRLLAGWAEIEVRRDGSDDDSSGDGSQLVWREEVGPRAAPLAALTPGPLQDRSTRELLRRMVADVVARAEERADGPVPG